MASKSKQLASALRFAEMFGGSGVPGGRWAEFLALVADAPERDRIGYRSSVGGWSWVVKVFPSRGAMETTIRMQESGPDFRFAWKRLPALASARTEGGAR